MYETWDDGESDFIDAVARHRILEPWEETQLGRRIQRGLAPKATPAAQADGLVAQNLLMEHNMKLVINIAKNYRGKGEPFADLIQEGVVGLKRAVEKFDPERGIKFSTYGTWWIRQACQRAVANHGDTIRVPIHVGDLRGKIVAVRRDNPDITVVALAARFETSVMQINAAIGAASVVASLEKEIIYAGEGSGQTLGDTIEDPNAVSPHEAVTDTKAEVLEAMRGLTEDEQRVIYHRFGFDGAPLGFRELADLLGMAQSRVQSLQKSALMKLELALVEPDIMTSFGGPGTKETGGHAAAERGRRASSTHVGRRRTLSPAPDFFGFTLEFGRCGVREGDLTCSS